MRNGEIINIESNSAAVIKYQTKIEFLIKKLNSLTVYEYYNQVNDLLQQIKNADQEFFAELGLKRKGHVLFTRHGESDTWRQKKFGLHPNAPVSETAMSNMSQTNESTVSLLHYPDKPTRIAVSPLVRAKQTASLIIPKDLFAPQITIQPALSENSHTPSGNNIMSLDQMKEELRQISFWQTPIKFLLYSIALWIFGRPEVFNQIQKNSIQADISMLQIPGVSSEVFYSQIKMNAEGKYFFDTSLSEEQKIKKTRQLIRENLKNGETDYWLIGHGQNFKSFFNHTFGIQSTFEFGETRCVYNVQTEPGVTSLFSPSYTFVIDQTTGRIRGKFTEQFLALEKNPWILTLVCGSLAKMQEKGLGMVSLQPTPSKQQDLENEKPNFSHFESPIAESKKTVVEESADTTPTPV